MSGGDNCYLTEDNCSLSDNDCYLPENNCDLTKNNYDLTENNCYLTKNDCYLSKMNAIWQISDGLKPQFQALSTKEEDFMKINRLIAATTTALILLTSLAMPNLAAPQALTSLKATASGHGTLTVGKEVLKVNTIVVQLDEDGTGEITVVTDLQFFVNCTWSAPADLSKGIDLKITGGTTASGATGSGKLMLRPNGKSIASLTMQGSSNTEKRKIQVNFVAE